MPHDGLEPGEVTLLLRGMFNLGFIAVGERRRRSSTGGRSDLLARARRSGQGQFVDQRWVDFVPSLFEHTVLADPACNVAHWNLETRASSSSAVSTSSTGSPLRFFHYSGFDPDKPHLFSKFLGPEPRILLSGHPALRQICSEYGEKLRAAGYREAKYSDTGSDYAERHRRSRSG